MDLKMQEQVPDRGFFWWLVDTISPILLMIALAFVVVHAVSARSRSNQARHKELSLDQVLERGNLPRSFSYGGVTWESRATSRPNAGALSEIGELMEDYPIYTPKGGPPGKHTHLLMRAGRALPGLFVRYEPAGSPG